MFGVRVGRTIRKIVSVQPVVSLSLRVWIGVMFIDLVSVRIRVRVRVGVSVGVRVSVWASFGVSVRVRVRIYV